jgi:hypothetical protein
VAGSFQGFDSNAAELDDGVIGERCDVVFGLGFRAEVDGGADAITELEMAGDEIGMEMGEEDMLDLEVLIGCEIEIVVDVSLRVDDGGDARGFIGDQIGSVGETIEVELLEDHAGPPE